MAKGIVLILGGILLIGLPIPFGAIIGIALSLYGVYCTLVGLKKFIFELIDHVNGAGTKTTTSRKDYTAEARDACEKVTPKRKREETPPWEK